MYIIIITVNNPSIRSIGGKIMKKIFIGFSSILIIGICIFLNQPKQSLSDSLYSKIIRFHVIANSDTTFDQNLKLKVKDKILEYISPKLKNSKNIEESREILKQNNKEIIAIAQNVINKDGYGYKVESTLSRENFPIKTYGNITLPQGNYEAYRVVIGEGKGQNWWCVMFPPLCFIDVSKGAISYQKTEDEMKKVLTEEEFKNINNNKIQFKFKFLEIIENIKKGTTI